MAERVIRLDLRVEAGAEADATELDELTGPLREELLELDIERAERASADQAPPGTRAGEVLVAGALTVMLAPSAGLLNALIETVQSWMCRGSERSVKLEIDGNVLEATAITRAEQRALIDHWIDRHTDR